jgi:hypothetical protein
VVSTFDSGRMLTWVHCIVAIVWCVVAWVNCIVVIVLLGSPANDSHLSWNLQRGPNIFFNMHDF